MGLFLIWFWLSVFELIATMWWNRGWPNGDDVLISIAQAGLVTVLIAGIWGTVIYFL